MRGVPGGTVPSSPHYVRHFSSVGRSGSKRIAQRIIWPFGADTSSNKSRVTPPSIGQATSAHLKPPAPPSERLPRRKSDRSPQLPPLQPRGPSGGNAKGRIRGGPDARENGAASAPRTAPAHWCR